MLSSATAFTLTLPLRPVVHRSLHTRRAPFRITRPFLSRATACIADVRIRRATPNDIPTAARVLASAFSEDFLTQESTPVPLLSILLPLYQFLTTMEISNQLHRRIKNDSHAILLAETDDKAVGCAEVGLLSINSLTKGGDEVKEWGQGGGEAYVGNVGVLPRYRGQGIGSRLVRSAQSVAEEWGLGCVWLCAEARNQGALRFYENLGFGCVAQEPEFFDEIGKKRRLFLCSCKGADVGQWQKTRVVGGKLGTLQYLRYCLWDLRRRREAEEKGME